MTLSLDIRDLCLARWSRLPSLLALVPRDAKAGPSRPQRYAIGIELLQYELHAILIDTEGAVLGKCSSSMESMTPETLGPVLASVCRDLMIDAVGRVLGGNEIVLGLELGAPVDTRTGTVLRYRRRPGKLGWSDYLWRDEPLGVRIQRATALRTVVFNDADAYAHFEHEHGVGCDSDRYAVLLVRDGIGCSVVANGSLLDAPMEIGNIMVHEDGSSCDCGAHGCVEVATGTRVLTAAPPSWIRQTVSSADQAVDLGNETTAEGSAALAALERAGQAIARTIGQILTLVKPSVVVVYVPLAVINPDSEPAAAFRRAAEQFTKYVSYDVFRGCRLVWRASEPFSGAHGAAAGALRRLIRLD